MDDSPYTPQLTPRKRQKHSGSLTGVKSVRPTWFQDTTATRGPPPSAGQGTLCPDAEGTATFETYLGQRSGRRP